MILVNKAFSIESGEITNCELKVKEQVSKIFENAYNNESVLKNKFIFKSIIFRYNLLPNESKVRVSISFDDMSIKKKYEGLISDFLKKYFSLNYPSQDHFYVATDDSCRFYYDNSYLRLCEGGNIPDFLISDSLDRLTGLASVVYLSSEVEKSDNCEIKFPKYLFQEKILDPSEIRVFGEDGQYIDTIFSEDNENYIFDLKNAPVPLYVKFRDYKAQLKKDKCKTGDYFDSLRIIATKETTDNANFCKFKILSKGKTIEYSEELPIKILNISAGHANTTVNKENLSCSAPKGSPVICDLNYMTADGAPSVLCENFDSVTLPKITTTQESKRKCKFNLENLDQEVYDIFYYFDKAEIEEKDGTYSLKSGYSYSPVTLKIVSKYDSAIKSETKCHLGKETDAKIKVKKRMNENGRFCYFSVEKEEKEIPLSSWSIKFQEKENIKCSGSRCSSEYFRKKVFVKAIVTVDETEISNSDCLFEPTKIAMSKKEKEEKEEKEAKKNKEKQQVIPPKAPEIAFPDLIPVPEMPILIDY